MKWVIKSNKSGKFVEFAGSKTIFFSDWLSKAKKFTRKKHAKAVILSYGIDAVAVKES